MKLDVVGILRDIGLEVHVFDEEEKEMLVHGECVQTENNGTFYISIGDTVVVSSPYKGMIEAVWDVLGSYIHYIDGKNIIPEEEPIDLLTTL